jgi:hypothetical protein
MCIGVYRVGLRWILTCYGFKPAQSHLIHVDYHQNEQALNGIIPRGTSATLARGRRGGRVW